MRLALLPMCLGIGLILAPATTSAQDVQYTTTTEIKMGSGGVVGFLARVAGVNQKTSETTYLSGTKIRTDADDGSVIMDMSDFSFTMLDHSNRSYTQFTFGDMAQMAEEGARQMEQARAEAERESPVDEEIKPVVQFDVDVRRTGERQDINGMNSERFLMTLKAEAADDFVDEEGNRPEGSMMIVTEMWNSRDVPHYDKIEAFYANFADVHGSQMQDMATSMSGIGEALTSDPRLKEGLERAAEEMMKAEGMTVRSTTHFVIVNAPDFDPNDVFAERERSGTGVGDAVRRGAAGALGRALGRRQQEQPREEEKEESRGFTTVMTMTTQLEDISSSPLDPSLFEIPEGYTKTQLPGMDG